MYGSVLVTPTLIDAMDWAKSAPPSWKDRAVKDFVTKIKRETVDYPDWVQWGMDFENTVYNVCNGSTTIDQLNGKGSDLFQDVCKQCFGGSFQNKLSKKLEVMGEKCFFFGYTDVDFPDKTIDIKTTIDFKGADKYLGKSQHKMYLWMNGKPHFEYLIVEWKAAEAPPEIRQIYTVKYENPGNDDLERWIKFKTGKLFEFIHEQNLWDEYYYTFSKN